MLNIPSAHSGFLKNLVEKIYPELPEKKKALVRQVKPAFFI